MSYDELEQSRTRGEPISLYDFFYINGQRYLYTDAEQNVTRADYTEPFEAIPIQHGRMNSSGTLDKATLDVAVPYTAKIADAFRVYPPNEVVNVVIRQYHFEDGPDAAMVVWTGRVLSTSRQNSQVTLSCEPISTSLRRPGLRRHYQLGCPHVLYGTQCGANKLSATTPDITIGTVGSNYIQLPANWLPTNWNNIGRTPSKFVGGLVTWSYDTPAGLVTMKRTVVSISANNRLTMTGTTEGLQAGSKVKLSLGCNHQMSDCGAIHNNVPNFGGQPFIPTKNPFRNVSQFY